MAPRPQTKEAIIRQKHLNSIPIRTVNDLERALLKFNRQAKSYSELNMEVGNYWVTVYVGAVTPRVKLCKYCQKPFSPLTAQKMYCSDPCKYKARERSDEHRNRIRKIKKTAKTP